jgi:hypothetical protein
MVDSLSKAIDFIIIIISILIIIGIFIYVYIEVLIVFKLLVFSFIIIYLPGKVFEKKANECYEELNKNHDN